jgi:hypothetical protein
MSFGLLFLQSRLPLQKRIERSCKTGPVLRLHDEEVRDGCLLGQHLQEAPYLMERVAVQGWGRSLHRVKEIPQTAWRK